MLPDPTFGLSPGLSDELLPSAWTGVSIFSTAQSTQLALLPVVGWLSTSAYSALPCFLGIFSARNFSIPAPFRSSRAIPRSRSRGHCYPYFPFRSVLPPGWPVQTGWGISTPCLISEWRTPPYPFASSTVMQSPGLLDRQACTSAYW